MSSLSIRKLALKMGLSEATVSEALRGISRVNPETRAKVQAAAAALGYQRNPLAGALMSAMRRSRAGSFRGGLAVVDLDGPRGHDAGSARYHSEVTIGATQRAKELGFKADVFLIGEGGLTLERLDAILQSRGIRGIFFLPVREKPDFTRLGWSRFSGIYSDYVIELPRLHTICPDHYRSMIIALQRLETLGYKRPGMVIEATHNERLLYSWEAGFHAYVGRNAEMAAQPPLILEESNQEDFTRWFLRSKCDVVLSHNPEMMGWMMAAGAKIPETHGFCCLNLMSTQAPCAGLNLQPDLLGRHGIELLVGQVLRGEVGVPEVPMTTRICSVWVNGPTVAHQNQGHPLTLFKNKRAR
jgi:DNA-binding LacI/PurR family transcriptional regulator